MTEHEIVKDCLISTPLIIKETNNPVVTRLINSMLSYDVGIEIECNQESSYDIELFKNIPNIMEVGSSKEEQRFRIPSGVNGAICLYEITEILKINCTEAFNAGIHYHIDFTDCYHLLTQKVIDDNSEWMLKELDTWGYKGTYNPRSCGQNSRKNWVNFQSCFKTMEIRIGEMSFDYSLIMTRIIHLNEIARRLKKIMISGYNSVNLNFLESQENQPETIVEPENPEEIILNRTVKRY